MNQRKNKAFLRNIKTKDEGVRVMIRVAFIEKREPVICSECGEVIDWKLVLPINLYYYKDRNIIANIIDTVECDQQTLMGTSMKMLTDKELSNILDLFDETAAREMANVFKCNGDERVFLRFSTQKTSMDFNKSQEDISDYMLKRLFVVMLVLADIYCFAGLLRSEILFDHIIYSFFLALLLVAEFFFFKIYYKRKYERPFTFILAQAQRARCKNCGSMTATEVDTDLVMLEINENIMNEFGKKSNNFDCDTVNDYNFTNLSFADAKLLCDIIEQRGGADKEITKYTLRKIRDVSENAQNHHLSMMLLW